MAAILKSAILNLAILELAILVFPLKLTHICQDWFPPFAQKKTITHSFSLNLMMTAILNSAMLDSDSAILDSDTLLSSLRFTQKQYPSTLTLTQTNSFWFTWWGQPSSIWPSWIQESQFFLSNPLTLAKIGSHHLHKKTFTHSYSLNLLMTAILNFAMLYSDTAILYSASALWNSDTLLSSLRFTQKHSPSTPSTLTLTPTNSIWFKLIHSHSIDDGSHLEFCYVGFRQCHLGFRHLVIFSQIHSRTLSLYSDSDSN